MRYLDPRLGGGGVMGGRVIVRELTRHFGDDRLEALGHPCAVVAADLLTGEEVVFTQGPVVHAVRASVAIPGLLAPVVDGARLLIDGGVLNPVPVSAARRISARPVVAVNLQSDYPARAALMEGRTRMLGITRTAIGLLLTQLARLSLTVTPADLEVELPVGHLDVGDFTRADELIALGRAAVMAHAARLRSLAAQRTGAPPPE